MSQLISPTGDVSLGDLFSSVLHVREVISGSLLSVSNYTLTSQAPFFSKMPSDSPNATLSRNSGIVPEASHGLLGTKMNHFLHEQNFISLHPKLLQLCAVATIAIALHRFVFSKGEWHLQAPAVLTAWLMLYPMLFIAEALIRGGSYSLSALDALTTLASFTFFIFASVAAGRLFFHRLGSFPGPKLARVSKLWHAHQCIDGKNHVVLERMHDQYGDFVRTGPNEVTIFDPDVLVKLDGPGNKTTKSIWYDFLMPNIGLTTIRDKKFHDKRRKIWTQAFSAKALPHYEEQTVEHTAVLERLVQKHSKSGTVVPFSQYAYWFSFDVMGMFVLSQSFNMLESEDWHYAIGALKKAMCLLGPLSSVPWAAQIGFAFLDGYWLVKDWHKMIAWCGDRMQDRIKIDDDNAKNVAAYLIADSKQRDSVKEDRELLNGESIVAIVAGSDTVAPTLVFLFYELARNPSQAQKLFVELEGVDVHDLEALKNLPHLNALINETLRLYPAVPTGGHRDTPAEGMVIGGRFIPGGTTVVAPRYHISRLESCYVDSKKFIPERWYSRPELIKNNRSFVPFAQGRYSCLGKLLALSELRVVTATLVSKYHIRFPEGDDGSRVENDMRDQFTAAPGQLDLFFEPRT